MQLRMANKLQVERIEGELKASGLRFGIVVSRFNSFITERLLAAAVDALERAGAAGEDVDVVRVPGAFELPLAAKKLAASGRYDALHITITFVRRRREGCSWHKWTAGCRSYFAC